VTDQLVEQSASVERASSQPGLSFGSWAFAFGPYESDPWSFERICRWIAGVGYDAIEINGFHPHPHDADFRESSDYEPLRRLLGETGLGISGFAPDFQATPPADVPASVYLSRFDSCLDFCEHLGIGTLRVDSISAPGPVDPARFEHLAATWRAAAQRAEDRGVRLVWEFEPGFWINRPSDVLRLLQTVDHANFRVMFDTSHAYTGAVAGGRQGPEPELLPGGVVEYARLLRAHLGALHLIDSRGELHDEETSEHLPFGTGRVDFDAVIDALGAAALDLSWWTIDFCFWPETERDAVAAVPFVRDLRDAAFRRAGR